MQYIDRQKDSHGLDDQGAKNELFLTINNMVYNYLTIYEAKLREVLTDKGKEDDNRTASIDFYSSINLGKDELISHDNQEVRNILNSLIKEHFEEIATLRLNSHKNTLLRNNAVIRFNQTGSFGWHYLPNNTKPSKEHLLAIEAVTAEYITDIYWLDEINIDGKDLVEFAESKVVHKVQILINLMDSKTPWNNKLVENKNFKIDYQISQFLDYLKDLAELSVALNYFLPEVLFDFLEKDTRLFNQIKKLVETRVDEQLAQINEAFMPPVLTRKDKKAKKAAEYAIKKLSIIEEIDIVEHAVDQIDEASNNHNSSELTSVLTFTDLGKLKYNFPWLNGLLELETTHITGGKKDVLLVSALTPKLEKISRIVRDGLPKTNGEDKIDKAIKQIVKRIAGGIMPYEDTNSIKRLSVEKKDLQDCYKDETIWYSFDISPNSPRVYFTLKELHNIPANESKNPTLQVVILAEADKARQLDTLAKLTNLDRVTLKARGAGSI